jgi:hypothetical protein
MPTPTILTSSAPASSDLAQVSERRRIQAPAISPQALAWHKGILWLSSRDEPRLFALDPTTWSVREEWNVPGIAWAGVSIGNELRFTLGHGEQDDRYVWRFVPGKGFDERALFPCPDFAGSYLSFDGEHLYLSQWYKHRILLMDDGGEIRRVIDVGAEICGHTFADGFLYVLRGQEQPDEQWSIARFDLREETASGTDLARVPFAARSLTFDGARFWSNHRAQHETVCFELPS